MTELARIYVDGLPVGKPMSYEDIEEFYYKEVLPTLTNISVVEFIGVSNESI